MDYAWPGNIRQLENAIEHAVAMSGGDREIAPAMLPEDIRIPGQASHAARRSRFPTRASTSRRSMSQLERELILRGLEKTGGNKRQAARLLQPEPHDAHRQAAPPRRRRSRALSGVGAVRPPGRRRATGRATDGRPSARRGGATPAARCRARRRLRDGRRRPKQHRTAHRLVQSRTVIGDHEGDVLRGAGHRQGQPPFASPGEPCSALTTRFSSTCSTCRAGARHSPSSPAT